MLGERSYPSLSAVPFPIDIADIFRRPDALPEVVEDAIRANVSPTVVPDRRRERAAIQMALDAGIKVVVDRCLKVEHARLLASRE